MLDENILIEFLAKVSIINGYAVDQPYIKAVIKVLEEKHFTNEELSETLDRIMELETYGKPPTLAMYLKNRTRKPFVELTVEQKASSEWSRILDLQSDYVTAKSTDMETQFNKITQKVFNKYTEVDDYGNVTCGLYVLLNKYQHAEKDKQPWVRKEFIDAWCDSYYNNDKDQRSGIGQRQGGMVDIGSMALKILAEQKKALEKKPKE